MNLYHPHPLLIDSGTFWRCDHGRTGFDEDEKAIVWIGCLKCAFSDPKAYFRWCFPPKENPPQS